MIKIINRKILALQAGMFVGFLSGVESASAQSNIVVVNGSGGSSNKNFSDIAENIIDSIHALPGLLSGLSYLIGSLMGVLGILKIKDHVENPSQTPLKEGAIRVTSGGALFALPIVFEAMQTTIGDTGHSVGTSQVRAVEFIVQQ